MNVLKVVRNACLDIKGSYALEIISKDFPEYFIVGGNPSRLIRSRLVDKI